jgi:NADPH2:quinone reductase
LRVGQSADVSIINGTPFSPILPAVLRRDVAGVVEAVGDGVTEFAPGDEVFGCVGGVRGSGGTLIDLTLERRPIRIEGKGC